MRIGFVSPHYMPYKGGIETLVQAIAERLASWGHQVEVLTLATSAKLPNTARSQPCDDPSFQRANIRRCLSGRVILAVLPVRAQERLRCSKRPQLPRIASLMVQFGSCSSPGSIDPLSREGSQQVSKLDASIVSSIGKLGGSSWTESNLRF